MQNLSTKELNYINDVLSWELLMTKKCYQYYHQETNQARQKMFLNNTDMHQQNYLRVLNYLDQINRIQGGQAH